MASIKIKVKESKGVVTVKALLTHPMETGARKDAKTGEKIPAHFIEEVVCTSGGKVRMTQLMSGGVSKNPYVSFMFTGGKKGDDVTLSWTDNTGKSDSETDKIS